MCKTYFRWLRSQLICFIKPGNMKYKLWEISRYVPYMTLTILVVSEELTREEREIVEAYR